MIALCYKCGTEWKDVTRKPGRSEYCEKCSAAWHCCRNCRFFDISAPNHCRSMTTDKVSDIEKPNFCDEFVLADAAKNPKTSQPKDDKKKRFDDLFKK